MFKKIVLSLSLTFFLNTNAQIINTIAGNGTQGFSGDGALATVAQLYYPSGGTLDKAGNYIFADAGNNRIRKINAGVISTIAGSSSIAGYTGDGGQATLAQMYSPSAVVLDTAGNMYITDTYNNCIRKVDKTGIITTIAGNPTAGYTGDGGPAVNAQLDYPVGLAIDKNNNLYIADVDNQAIRKIDTAGIITTVAGMGPTQAGYTGDGGPAIAARMNYPYGISVDADGNLIISDTRNMVVRKVDTLGIITTIAGNSFAGSGGDGGPALSASLNQPYSAAYDYNGNLYIVDTWNSLIRKVNTSGIITTIAGNNTTGGYSGDGGPAINASLNKPTALCIDSLNNIYIADGSNMRVRYISVPATSLNFSGGTNVCKTPKFSNVTNNFTLEARVKWSGVNTGTTQMILQNGNTSNSGYGFYIDNFNSNQITVLASGVNYMYSTATLTPNKWQMLTFVRVGGYSTLYLDGVAYGLSNNGTVPLPVTGDFSIGSDQIGTENFQGSFDEVRFWSRPLCLNEIQSRLSCSLKGNEPGLLAYYNFNQGISGYNNGTVVTLYDSSGNNHHIPLTGFTLNGPKSNWLNSENSLGEHCFPYLPPIPTVTVTGNTTFCLGDSVVLSTTANASTYLWSNGATTPVAVVKTGGKDSVTVTNPGGCYGTVSSTPVNIVVASPATPSICEVTTDSVTNYNYNYIYWNKTGYTNVDSFIIYRYDVVSVDYLRIGAVSKDSLSVFMDTCFSIGGPNGGNPQYGSWQYKLAIRDTCGNIGKLSNYHQTTFLQQSGSNFSWNAYVDSGFVHPPTGYSFMRDDNNTGVYHVLANVSGTSSSDPNYASYPNGNWRVDPLGFNCTPTVRLSGNNSTEGTVVKSRSNVKNNRLTGSNQNSFSRYGVKIYPNPNSGQLNLTISQFDNLKINFMEIYNVLGEKVYTSRLDHPNSSHDITTFAPGVYQMKIVSDNKIIHVEKIIKQ